MLIVGRDISVGAATRYALDVPGIDSLWGQELPQPSRPALGPNRGTRPLSREERGRVLVLTNNPYLAPRLKKE
jgi:hypothetical protein